jgi:hypothetical protein
LVHDLNIWYDVFYTTQMRNILIFYLALINFPVWDFHSYLKNIQSKCHIQNTQHFDWMITWKFYTTVSPGLVVINFSSTSFVHILQNYPTRTLYNLDATFWLDDIGACTQMFIAERPDVKDVICNWYKLEIQNSWILLKKWKKEWVWWINIVLYQCSSVTTYCVHTHSVCKITCAGLMPSWSCTTGTV